LRDRAQHFLGEVHEVAVVAVGLVELEHRELGLCRVEMPSFRKFRFDLEDLFESAHHQALEIELRCDRR